MNLGLDTYELHDANADLDFAISAEDLPIARVARQFPGIAQALLGHSTYVVEFEPVRRQSMAELGANLDSTFAVSAHFVGDVRHEHRGQRA